MDARIEFEPLRIEDLPLLHAWRSQPHVARWWGGPKTLAEVEAEYSPMISGADQTHCYIASVDGRAAAMIQTYLWANEPDWEAAIQAEPGEAGIDYFIGEPDMIGHGLGPRIITRFLDEIVFANPIVSGVRTDVEVDNPASWRTLEKLGFSRGPEITLPDGKRVYVPSLRRDQRSAAGQTSW